jgi:hypothetical protein
VNQDTKSQVVGVFSSQVVFNLSDAFHVSLASNQLSKSNVLMTYGRLSCAQRCLPTLATVNSSKCLGSSEQVPRIQSKRSLTN